MHDGPANELKQDSLNALHGVHMNQGKTSAVLNNIFFVDQLKIESECKLPRILPTMTKYWAGHDAVAMRHICIIIYTYKCIMKYVYGRRKVCICG